MGLTKGIILKLTIPKNCSFFLCARVWFIDMEGDGCSHSRNFFIQQAISSIQHAITYLWMLVVVLRPLRYLSWHKLSYLKIVRWIDYGSHIWSGTNYRSHIWSYRTECGCHIRSHHAILCLPQDQIWLPYLVLDQMWQQHLVRDQMLLLYN